MISLRVGDALHRVDGNVVRSSDHAHAWAILLAQIGEDRAFDVSIDLGSSERGLRSSERGLRASETP